MLSGAELNQLLMPAKFGAVPCAAATANGAVWPRAAPPLTPDRAAPTRQRAITEADVASERIVMEVSFGRGLITGRSGRSGRMLSATPRSACRIGNRTRSRTRSRRRQTPAAVLASALLVVYAIGVFGCRDDGEDRTEDRTGAGRPD